MEEENKIKEKKVTEKNKESKEEKKNEKEIAGAEKPSEEVSKKIKEEVKEKEKAKPLKKEGKKEEGKITKTEAVVYGKDLGISKKHAVAICDFIRGRKIEEAVFLLQEVSQMKRAVPMKGEIPHRKGRIMSGRYPINAVNEFLKLLKQLSANSTVAGLELEKGRIECKADKAARPYKRFGNTRFKRTHVKLKLTIEENKK